MDSSTTGTHRERPPRARPRVPALPTTENPDKSPNRQLVVEATYDL